MNISVFYILHKANSKDKIELSESHKDFNYMFYKEWITKVDSEPKLDERSTTPILYMQYSGYVAITSKGKDAYFAARNSWTKWILGSIISVSIAFTGVLLKMLL